MVVFEDSGENCGVATIPMSMFGNGKSVVLADTRTEAVEKWLIARGWTKDDAGNCTDPLVVLTIEMAFKYGSPGDGQLVQRTKVPGLVRFLRGTRVFFDIELWEIEKYELAFTNAPVNRMDWVREWQTIIDILLFECDLGDEKKLWKRSKKRLFLDPW